MVPFHLMVHEVKTILITLIYHLFFLILLCLYSRVFHRLLIVWYHKVIYTETDMRIYLLLRQTLEMYKNVKQCHSSNFVLENTVLMKTYFVITNNRFLIILISKYFKNFAASRDLAPDLHKI